MKDWRVADMRASVGIDLSVEDTIHIATVSEESGELRLAHLGEATTTENLVAEVDRLGSGCRDVTLAVDGPISMPEWVVNGDFARISESEREYTAQWGDGNFSRLWSYRRWEHLAEILGYPVVPYGTSGLAPRGVALRKIFKRRGYSVVHRPPREGGKIMIEVCSKVSIAALGVKPADFIEVLKKGRGAFPPLTFGCLSIGDLTPGEIDAICAAYIGSLFDAEHFGREIVTLGNTIEGFAAVLLGDEIEVKLRKYCGDKYFRDVILLT
ncbi:MAG: hypothetical protein ACUVXI_11755 [bacterium]